MVLIVNTMRDLDFSKIADLYKVDIEKERRASYGYLDPYEGRRCAENDLYYYLKDIFFGESRGVYYILREHGAYLSALRLEPYADGMLLNALITDESHRNKGYASILLKNALDSVPGPIYSHIHNKNAASISLHSKFGFRKLYDHAVLLDGTVCTDHITYIRNG